MKHSVIENLRLIAEYVYYSDAPALLGIPRSALTKYARGASPKKSNAEKIARLATKIRRRESQIKRYAREKAERVSRREYRKSELIRRQQWRDTLAKYDYHLELPYRIPALLRDSSFHPEVPPLMTYDLQTVGAAIDEYNQMTDEEFDEWSTDGIESKRLKRLLNYFMPGDDDLEEWKRFGMPSPRIDLERFYDAMRHVMPKGMCFFRYEVQPGGTTEQGGRIVDDGDQLRMYNKDVFVINTEYFYFNPYTSRNVPKLTLRVESVDKFMFRYDRANDHTQKRRAIEVTVTYPKMKTWNVKDLEFIAQEGLHPFWGAHFIFD
jgi:hypothetical protein